MILPKRKVLIPAALLIIALVASAADPGHDEFLYARKLYDEGYYDLAAEQLDRCLRDSPGMADAPEAQFLLGESYLKAGDPEKARSALLKAAIVYPQSPTAPDALFEVGVALEAMSRPGEAAQSYERVQGFYSGHRLAPEGLRRAAMLYHDSGDSARTEAVIDLLLDKYPESEAADAARLLRAEMLVRAGDADRAEQYYQWVATRTTSDSLAAEAWYQLGKYRRARWAFSNAADALRKGVERSASNRQADGIRLELADLLTLQGQPDEALKVVEPLITSKERDTGLKARIETGDAYYRQGNFQKALENYHAAIDDPQGALKAAWTAEMLVSPETALDRYKKLAVRQGPEASAAKLRAAVLAGQLKHWDDAARLWEAVITDKGLADSSGRVRYEYLRTRQRAGLSIAGIVDSVRATFPKGFWSDEIAYLAYVEAFNVAGASDKGVTPPLPEEYLREYPASIWLDSAYVLQDFELRHHHRSEHLMERMAELSSRPLGKVTPVQWALDWGEFYLNDFKDPVKAIDQFDRVRDDTAASAEGHRYALRRGTEAYLLLYEESLWEKDRIGTAMYGDSVRNRLGQLKKVNTDAKTYYPLASEALRLDLKSLNGDSARNAATLKRGADLMLSAPAGAIPSSVVLAYLSARIGSGVMDSSAAVEVLKFAPLGIAGSQSDRLTAYLHFDEILAQSARNNTAATDSASHLMQSAPMTPGGAAATAWLMDNPNMPAAKRLALLDQYRQNYPYLGEPVELDQLASDLNDSAGKPLEALSYWERAQVEARWSVPMLDILNVPDDAARLRRGRAFLAGGILNRAEEEYQALLNFSPSGKLAPAAFLAMADIRSRQGNPGAAAAMLDSLAKRFPFAPETVTGLHLEARLLMDAADWRSAQRIWKRLATGADPADSISLFESMDVVCLYRLGDADAAKKATADFIKKYKDRPDAPQYRAQFLYEKGKALDRAHQYDDAQKQYRSIHDDYSMTKWADDAAYANALSIIAAGKAADGAKALSRFVEDHPTSPLKWEALLSLGLTAYRNEKYPEAAGALKSIWEDSTAQKSWKSAFDALVTVYKDSHFWDAALHLTREYIARFPDAPDEIDRRMDIGWLYLQTGEWDEAIRQYRSLLPLSDAEQEAEVQYYIGEAFLSKGDYRTAILEYLKVKILGRKTKLDWGVTALYQAGICHEKLGEKDGAARMYQRIIDETGATSNYGRTAQQRLDALKQ